MTKNHPDVEKSPHTEKQVEKSECAQIVLRIRGCESALIWQDIQFVHNHSVHILYVQNIMPDVCTIAQLIRIIK